jgi:hypothetical protein
MNRHIAVRSFAVSLALLAGLVTTSIASADPADAQTQTAKAGPARSMAPRASGFLRISSAGSHSSTYHLPPHGGWHGAISRVGTSHAP